MTFAELVELLNRYGQKSYLAEYFFSFIHSRRVSQIGEITPLALAFRQKLQEDGYFITDIVQAGRLADPDGTVKFVFQTEDGCRVESVRLQDGRRSTLCISSQAGCKMGCLFCATGQLRFERSLTAGQIADQVYKIEKDCGKANNIVYMGMGEPLDNFDEVIKSVEILNDNRGAGIGIRHITVSTCGLPDAIERLADAAITPRLAVSLNAADDDVRTRLMKIAKKYPLKKLMAALRNYQKKNRRRITFEYCMIEGINDSDQQAKKLLNLLKGLMANVNLIEFNPFEGCGFVPSSPRRIGGFASILQQGGLETVIRYKRGQKIRAACGQLGADWLGKSRESGVEGRE